MDITEGTTLAALLAALVAGAAGYLFGRRRNPKAKPKPEPKPEPAPAPEPAPEPNLPGGPTSPEPVPEPEPTTPPPPSVDPADPPDLQPEPEPGPLPDEPDPVPAPDPAEPIVFPPPEPRQPFIEPGLTHGHLYVDPVHGADSNSGDSPERAVRTVHEAIRKASPGNVVLLRRGTLRPKVRHVISKPLTIMGYGDERPRFDLTDLTDAVQKSGGKGSDMRVFTPRVPGVHLKGMEFLNGRGMDGGCIYVDVDDVLVEDMHAHDVDTSVVYVYGGSARIRDVVVWRIGDGVSQHTNVPDGIVVTGKGHDVEIIRPVVLNGPDDGIDLYESHDVLVRWPLIVGAGFYWNGKPGGSSSGDGNGVKLGGARAGTGYNRTVGGLVIGSRSTGVSHNQAPEGNIVVERTTTIRNGYHGVDVGSAAGNAVRRSAAWGDARGHYASGSARSEGNTWDQGIEPIFRMPHAADFAITNAPDIGAEEETLAMARYWLNRADVDYHLGNAENAR